MKTQPSLLGQVVQRTAARQRTLLVGAALVVVVAATARALVPTPASGADSAPITNAVRAALQTDDRATLLPEGFEAGHASPQALQAFRNQLAAAYSKAFTGQALTNRLNGMLAWADRIAVDAGEVRLLKYQAKRFDFDTPLVSLDHATVTGSYEIWAQQAANGERAGLMTWGGTYKQSLTAQLTKVNGEWLVSDLAKQQTDFEPDDSVISLPSDQGSGATKPPLSTSEPFAPGGGPNQP